MNNSKTRYYILLPLLIMLFGTSCAKRYDPEEVCTAKWIKPRVDQAMADFKEGAASAFETLGKTSEKVAAKGELGQFDKISAMISLASLAYKFKNGDAVKDLRILGDTCKDPKLVSKAFSGYLEEQGAPKSIIQLLNDVDAFQKLIAEGT